MPKTTQTFTQWNYTVTEMLDRWGIRTTVIETGIPGQDLLRMSKCRIGHPVYASSYLTEQEVLHRRNQRGREETRRIAREA